MKISTTNEHLYKYDAPYADEDSETDIIVQGVKIVESGFLFSYKISYIPCEILLTKYSYNEQVVELTTEALLMGDAFLDYKDVTRYAYKFVCGLGEVYD